MSEVLLTPERLANILAEVGATLPPDFGIKHVLSKIEAKLRVGQCEAESGFRRCQMYADHAGSHYSEDSLGSTSW